jgi:membrane-bound lytic murein transglycosylase D
VARRHRVKLTDLIMANNLNSRATIYVGQNLRIPLADEKIVLRKPESAEITLAALKTETAAEPVVKKVKQVVCPLPPNQPVVKEVVLPEIVPEKVTKPEKEITIKPVAVVETEAVAELLPGEPGKLPGSREMPVSEINSSVVIGDFEVMAVRCLKGQRVGTIQVQVGETLGHYADWLEIPTRQIRRLNGLPFGRSIQLDQKITIPLINVSAAEFSVKRYEYHKEIEEDFFAAYKVEEVRLYKVKPGDNIWNLCLEFDLPFWLISKYNMKINLNSLRPGQEMNVPVVRPTAAGLEDI